MSLGTNIAYLRKQKTMTQEQLAERMGVTRQTVSRWESDEVTPELAKLVEMCEVFSCRLDGLVREDLSAQSSIYSPVTVKHMEAFRMAGYVIISPNPEHDALSYMKRWAEQSGLLSRCPQAKLIGWDFPFVTQEQQNRFGMHGYAAAFILPEGFGETCTGVQYSDNRAADYAVITITEPHIQPFERIPRAYKIIMEHLSANNFREKPREGILGCFEHEYEKDGVEYMDVYVHVDSVTRADAFSSVGKG